MAKSKHVIIGGHTPKYLKKVAKAVQKEQGVVYRDALDIVAKQADFSSWNNFISYRKR
ncbi:hypothetical protein PQ469_06025 [Mucilaginibacter sp. KACC 22773]|uniref:hypothetical protein n=1 Tax=Mucilaginibacter sp. KACC 22773 TaxID=3025671 RepID=UPI0023669846|nr:hypothetical protein [Mucilaginibacter sp. KACC 22773]WDF79560.1 hypothetical protein PQ469_06025 [Mucilaginibacter sp. KACC 22773]